MNRAGLAMILSAVLAPWLFAQVATTNRPDVIAGGGGAQSYLSTTNLSVLAQPIAGERTSAGTLFNFSGFLGMFDGGLSVPTNVFATTTNISVIIVSWNSVPGARKYEVRWTNTSNSATNWVFNVTNTYYVDTNAGHNTNYYYQVRAREEYNVSRFSDPAAMGHRQCAPPSNVVASKAVFTNKVAITWYTVEGATNYLIYRNTSNSTVLATNLATAISSTNYDDTNAAANVRYYYFIQAANSVCTGDFSTGAVGYIKSATPVITASKGAYTDKVQVSWTEPPGATHYFVYRNTSTNPPDGTLANTTNRVYDDFSAAPGVLYYYFVKSADNVSTSDFSLPDTGWLTSAPPASLSASWNTYTNQVQLTWSAVAGTVAYRIYRATSGSQPVNFTATSTATNYTDTTTEAEAGIPYYYWVDASNAVVISAPVGPAAGVARLWPPAGLTASTNASLDTILVSWSASANAARYEIRRDTDPATEPDDILAMPTTTQYEDGTADSGLSYYYWVRAINADSTSDVSRTASAGWRQLAAPTGVTATKGVFTRKIRVSWNTVTGAANYLIQRSPPSLDMRYDATNSPPYDDFGAAIGTQTQYVYTVKAANRNTTSEPSVTDYGWRHSVFADYDGDSKSDLALLNKSLGVLRVYLSANYYAFISVYMTNIPPVIKATWTAQSDTDSDQADYESVCTSVSVDLVNIITTTIGPTPPTTTPTTTGPTTIGPTTIPSSITTITTTIPYDPVAGDYDGDGKSDPAMYQQTSGKTSLGRWRYMLSKLGYGLQTRDFGGTGIKPLSGDYDGDGTNDFVVYKTNQISWMTFSLSSYNYTPDIALPFTAAGWIPVAGDYDGDGRTDPAIFVPASGQFVALLSASGYNETNLWNVGPGLDCVPVAGDYDGDGIFDPCLYSPSAGLMGALLSFVQSPDEKLKLWSFGAPPADCLPVGGDYDGDGVTDPMIYGESQGYWAVFMSSYNPPWNQPSAAVSGFGGTGLVPVR